MMQRQDPKGCSAERAQHDRTSCSGSEVKLNAVRRPGHGQTWTSSVFAVFNLLKDTSVCLSPGTSRRETLNKAAVITNRDCSSLKAVCFTDCVTVYAVIAVISHDTFHGSIKRRDTHVNIEEEMTFSFCFLTNSGWFVFALLTCECVLGWWHGAS